MCRPCSHLLIGSPIHLFIQQTLCIINHMPCKEDLQYVLILTLQLQRFFISSIQDRREIRQIGFWFIFQKVLKKIQEDWLSSFIVRNQNLDKLVCKVKFWYKWKKYFNWIIFYISRQLYSISISSIIVFNIICMCQVNCSGHLFGSLKINLNL